MNVIVSSTSISIIMLVTNRCGSDTLNKTYLVTKFAAETANIVSFVKAINHFE